MNANGRQPTQELRKTQASRFADARRERPELYRQDNRVLVVVTRDEELLDGDEALGSDNGRLLVRRESR